MNRYKLIAFEPISENEITNYSFDGIENQEKPLNPNEEFIQLTSKIDFKKLNGKTLDYTTPDFPSMDEESEPMETFQLNLNENIKKHLTTTLNEINALIDILQVSKDNTYMQFKRVHKESHEDNIISYVAAKKMGLSTSSQTLLNAAVRLSKTLSSIRDQNQQNSFYSDLATLRREWRIKWQQKHLVGDLGLTSCGSLFPEPGGFQILEKEEDNENSEITNDLDLQSLKIILMNNQEGEPLLKVNISDGGVTGRNDSRSFNELPEARECKLQAEKLNRAQNLLFLHEIFSTMCWESHKLICPVLVKESQLIINVKGKISLCMDFTILPEKHWFGYTDNVTESVLETRAMHELTLNQLNLFSDSMIVFLRDLLREKHRSNSCAHYSLTNPIAGPVQIPVNQRYRGTSFYRAIDYSPAEQCHVVFLLPSLLDAVTFYQARADVLTVLDRIADIQNGSISVQSHINSTQSMLHCSINLIIASTTYTSLQHYFTLTLSVLKGVTQLNIISDRVRHNLVYETIDVAVLTSFFESQIWNFKIDVIFKLATIKHNWHLVDLRMTNCQKTMKDDALVEISLLSKNGTWLLNIAGRKNSQKYQLSVSHSRVEDFSPVEWIPINLLQLQRKLMKSDLQTLDVLFTALY